MGLIYNLSYYTALFLIPFIVYFLIFKKNDGRSIYTGRDWYYFIKLYYAKREVEKYKEKYRKRCSRQTNNHEGIVEMPTVEHSNTQSILAVDQKGNNLSLTFTLWHGNVAEVDLHLRLADGHHYIFPGHNHIFKRKIARPLWKINRLTIVTLEPMRRFRFVFNGLLQNVAITEYEKVEHVQFHLIFNASGSPTYFPHDMETDLLAEALTRETWRDGSWKHYLVSQPEYEQFGALQGFVKGDSYPNEYIVNLACVRSGQSEIDDRFLVNRKLRMFMVDTYGNLINVVIKSFRNGCSQVNYGSAILSNNRIYPISGLDILLKNVGQHKILPETMTLNITVKSKLFICVLHLNKSRCMSSSNNEENGYECYNLPGECNINRNQGHAIVEFWYSKQGNEKFVCDDLLCSRIVGKSPGILVTNIESEEAKILTLTGGKGNSLALLAGRSSEDYVIPDGFIITVDAFKLHVRSSPALTKALLLLSDVCRGRKIGKLEDICNETVEVFKREKLLPEIVDGIMEELDRIKDGFDVGETRAWAVRSSAVGEDSEELSAAGQNETFLGCLTVDQVLKSVAACWASLFTFQSTQYRREHGLPILARMAVVVQNMVPADAAGVLFTCHPSTGNPSQMVVTSNFGLGESVVSGKSDPDTFVINRTWDDKICVIDSRLGDKNKIIKMTNRGVEECDGNELVDSEGWSITQTQVLRLGKLGVQLEKAFGGSRDVEFAFHKDRLYLLQSRPVTTLSSWSDFELTHEMDYPILSDKLIFTVANVGEVVPNSVTVLSQTSSMHVIDRSMQENSHLHYDPLVSKAICLIQHRAMLEIVSTLHKNVDKEINIASVIIDLAVLGHSVLDENMHRIMVERLGVSSSYSKLRQTLHILYLAMNNSKTYEKIREHSVNLKIDIKDGDALLIIHKKIGESFEGGLLPIARFHTHTSMVCLFYQLIAMIVLCGGSKELTMEHYSDLALLLSSCEDVISVEIPRYLGRIARIIREEGYDEEFCAIKPEFGATWLQAKCPEAFRVFKEFLEHHGHRSLGEFEVMEKTWAEDPSKVIVMIQANAKYERKDEKTTLSIDEMVKRLVSPKNVVTRSILKFFTNRIRSAVGLRELSKSEVVRSINVLRQAYRELAKRMVLHGLLPSTDLIYHLTHYEIGQVIQRQNPLLVTKATKRQRLYPKWCKLNFPEIMFGTPVPEKEEEFHIDSKSVLCRGTPVCIGTVKGRACVIRNLEEIDQLQRGDVLITYSTDIGWSPYFPMLSGIVTELGGLISHGAVVAREYGLPCIVGAKNATKCFRTGDIVLLSANTGEIAIV